MSKEQEMLEAILVRIDERMEAILHGCPQNSAALARIKDFLEGVKMVKECMSEELGR